MDYVVGRVQDLLRPFKESENPSNVKFIANDNEAILILSIWSDLPVLLKEPLVLGGPPLHKPNLWKYVWKYRRIDYREIEKKTGLSDRKVIHEKLNLLVNHQLIYPDGSISHPA